MLTIRKYDEGCDGPGFEGKYIAYLDLKDHGYVMGLTPKNFGRLFIRIFNRKAMRPFSIYAN